MSYHFTQELTIHQTGAANSVRVTIGVPTPVADDFVEGSELVEFNQHPYIGKDGYGGVESEFPEDPVESCKGSLVKHYLGETSTVYEKDYGEHPSFWGIAGEETQFEFEVGYDTTVYVDWTLDRVVFPLVVVEKNDKRYMFENVPCLFTGESDGMLRMWGETESWLSEGEKILFWPYLNIR